MIVVRFIIKPICPTFLNLPHKMSRMEHWDYDMFASQHFSANIKASGQGSSPKSKKQVSWNQVDAPAKMWWKCGDKNFQPLD